MSTNAQIENLSYWSNATTRRTSLGCGAQNGYFTDLGNDPNGGVILCI